MQTIMSTPGMDEEIEKVTEEGGNAALIAYLDEHGLSWRAGGSDPFAALADAEIEWLDDDEDTPFTISPSASQPLRWT